MRMRPLDKPRKLVAMVRTGRGTRQYHLIPQAPEVVAEPTNEAALCGGRPGKETSWGKADPNHELSQKCCDKCFERQTPDERKAMMTMQKAALIDDNSIRAAAR